MRESSAPESGPRLLPEPGPLIRSLPNMLTVVRGLLVVPVVVLLLHRTRMADWTAYGSFVLAATTDGIDGALARRWKVVSSAGQFLDPLVDKVLVIAPMSVLVYLHRFPLWAAIVIAVREIAVTILRTMASRRGHGFPANTAGKWKTVAQLAAIAAFVVPSHAVGWMIARWFGIAVAIVLTIISGYEYFRQAPRLLAGRR